LAASVLLVVIVVRSPETLLSRYRTILGAPSAEAQDVSEPSASEEETERTASALQSAAQRRVLFLEALKLTVQHPIFGVGPGMFKVASNPPGTNRLGWKETHNTYAQISSELGIPALVFFLACLWHCLKTSYLCYRRFAAQPAQSDLSSVAQCLFLCLVVFVVGAVFTNLAYDFFFPVLAGIAVGLEFATRGLVPHAPSLTPNRGVPNPLNNQRAVWYTR
jgi:O-antigen ligase